MIAGLPVFFEKSTECWQHVSGLGTLGEPEPSTLAVLAECATVHPRLISTHLGT